MTWSERLSRRTNSGRYVAVIDGLRFVSIFLVVAHHVSGYLGVKTGVGLEGARADPLGHFFDHGHYGVQIFFAISGFVLALPFAAHHLQGAPRLPLREYFMRRLTRIEPPYLIVMLVAALGSYAVGGSDRLGEHLAASLVYLHNIIYRDGSTVLGVAWSLEVEVQFYLLAPLLCAILFRPRGRVTRRLTLLGTMVAVVLAQHTAEERLTPSLIWQIQYFLPGILAADLFLVDWAERPVTSLAWDGVMAAVCGALYLCWERMPTLAAAIAFPPLLFVLFVAAFRGRLSSRVLSVRWIAVIGGMCYSIYLLHYMVISVTGRLTVPLLQGEPFWAYLLVHLALFGAAVLAVSATFFVLVERPCMRRDWPRRALASLRAGLDRMRRTPVEPALEVISGDG